MKGGKKKLIGHLLRKTENQCIILKTGQIKGKNQAFIQLS